MSTPTFEHILLDTVRDSIAAHLNGRLKSEYRSPLDPYLEDCIKRHATEIAGVYDSAVEEAIRGADLKAALAEAFTHKLARVLVGKFEGEIERRAVEMKSDPAFRARVTLAIEAAVKGVIK